MVDASCARYLLLWPTVLGTPTGGCDHLCQVQVLCLTVLLQQKKCKSFFLSFGFSVPPYSRVEFSWWIEHMQIRYKCTLWIRLISSCSLFRITLQQWLQRNEKSPNQRQELIIFNFFSLSVS
jgi:hypothetical protein